ncbi:MAG: porin [Nitrospirota bacterium]
MKMSIRILTVFLFISLLAPIAGLAEEVPSEKEVGAVFPEKQWFEDVHMAGFVDTYFSYNLNNPDSMKNTYGGLGSNFDFEHNTFSLSLAELVFHKDPDPVGFRVDLDFGPTTDFVHCGAVNCPDTAGEANYKNIQQAYVSWATPLGPKLEVGKFVTHMGAEVIESKDNWNYTRSLLFAYAIPYYHAGTRVNIPVNDMFFVNGYAYNGWNNVVENNDSKTFGATIGITPIPQLPILLNWIGPEEAFGDLQVYEAIATLNLTDSLSFMVDYNLGDRENAAGKDEGYSGIAAYARWKKDPCALAVRYENLKDDDGVIFGMTDNTISELTVTAEHTIAKNLLTRLEYRMDSADEKIFEDEDAQMSDSQSRIVLSAVYMF